MEIYNFEETNLLNKINKKIILIFIFLGVVSLAICVGLGFLISDNTVTLITSIYSVLLSLYFCLLFYFIYFVVVPNRRHIFTLRKISNSEKVILEGKLVNISNLKTIKFTEKAYEITVLLNNYERTYYLDDKFDKSALEISKTYKFSVRSDYITEIDL